MTNWPSPIPEKRWKGFRKTHKDTQAFQSLEHFEKAQMSELAYGLSDHELVTLGRLLNRGVLLELEVFIRTHGPNPIFDPQEEIDSKVGVAKSDVVDLTLPASPQSHDAILKGEVVHVLFQAGEASRFQKGPFYGLSPVFLARKLSETLSNDSDPPAINPDFSEILKKIDEQAKNIPAPLASLLKEGPLGPKQPIVLRAALRRVIQEEVDAGRINRQQAIAAYNRALKNQKLLFFVSRHGDVNLAHDKTLRHRYKFYGFDPRNVVTIEQELVRGITANEEGQVSLTTDENTMDAAGHFYALIQAARTGDFTTYTESGRPIKPMELDALAYLSHQGASLLNIIRINDMDRHTTEILNAKALSYALTKFSEGYVNIIETVGNPEQQKGGTGLTFDNPDVHYLTETHENSFPSLSRVFETALKKYLENNQGRHPAYNAMRQWAKLNATRQVIKEYGGRIVYVPRQKNVDGQNLVYLGVDMPMGDLSLLGESYKSRMFQFLGPQGRELLIHDVKKKENLTLALWTIFRQLEDPYIIAAGTEILGDTIVPFEKKGLMNNLYGAPTPEFEEINIPTPSATAENITNKE